MASRTALQDHIVIAGYELWGHTRPLCTLATRIVKSRKTAVTFFVPRPLYSRLKLELSRGFSEDEKEMQARLTMIALATDEKTAFDIELLEESFKEAFTKLVKGQPIRCAQTHVDFQTAGLPKAVILDLFGYHMMLVVRKLAPKPTKVILWCVGSPAAIYVLSGMFSYNNDGKARQRIDEEAKRTGRSRAEIVYETCCPQKGDVIRVPGFPPIYDYENFPQEEIDRKIQDGDSFLGATDLFLNCDGVLFGVPKCYECPEVIEFLSKWSQSVGKALYCIGPVQPVGPEAIALEELQSPSSPEINEFRKQIMRSHGPKSLVYISFGSVYWPAEAAKAWTFLETLLSLNRPFIMSCGSPLAQVPESTAAKVKASGIGFLSKWSPQQSILNDPVTGWFVTHAGYNSIMESIMAGVPLICWPFMADQPINALNATEILGIGYELFSVRTGVSGLKPIYRTGLRPATTLDNVRNEAIQVLDQAYGADGEAKRQRVRKLREACLNSLQEHGDSYRALEDFLDSV